MFIYLPAQYRLLAPLLKAFGIFQLWLLAFAAVAQPQGNIFIKNFPITEYGAGGQNWDIAQGRDGLIYVANNYGVLQYDGHHWRTIALDNNVTARGIVLGHDSVLYVGAEYDFGYLIPTEQGGIVYKSLKSKLDSASRGSVDIVWKTHALPSGIYFRTNKVIYRYHNNKITQYEASTRFYRTFAVGDKLYAEQKSIGLVEVMLDGSLRLIKNGELYADDRMYAVLPHKQGKWMMVSKTRGLHLFDSSGVAEADIFSSMLTDNPEFFDMAQNTIYSAIQLPTGNYAFGSLGKGVAIIDAEARLLHELNKNAGLQDESAICLFVDSQNGLWVGLNIGIARCEVMSPWQYWNDYNGIKGGIDDMVIFENDVYVGTEQGLFRSTNNMPFEPVEGMDNSQVWHLMVYKSNIIGGNDKLLAAGSKGVFEVSQGKANMILSTQLTGLVLHQKKGDPSVVYVGMGGAMMVLLHEKAGWLSLNNIDGISSDVESIVEDRRHNLWISTSDQKIYKLEFGKPNAAFPIKIIPYGEDKGIISSNGFLLHNIDGQQVALATENGLMVYNEDLDAFTGSTFLGTTFSLGREPVFIMQKGENDDYWVSASNLSKGMIGRVDISDGTFYNRLFKRLPKMEVTSMLYDKGSLWVSGGGGLYRYDIEAGNQLKPDDSFTAMVRNVYANTDSLIFGGNFFRYVNEDGGDIVLATQQSEDWTPEMPYEFNTIEFNFTSNSFDNASSNTYSYYLEGHDQGWSSWTYDTKLRFTDLSHGKYVFRVKARNVYGDISREAAFAFRIQTPWYFSIFAYILYAILFVLFIAGIVWLNSRRLQADKKRLEEVVRERTTALAEQTRLLEKKNKDTTDSINYAKRILNALHTSHGKLKDTFSESFMLFKPKDIVSGDFFWLTHAQGKTIMAVVDCTGHGIPGAFMSVIGHALLKEIVEFYQIVEPHRILSSLHEMIRESLNQRETANKDGMDIVICVIDEKNKTLEFAGARNPLVYLQNGEIQVIKGDRLSVGGDRFNNEEYKDFSKHVIHLSEETNTFYLYSDGFQDQFNEAGDKYTVGRFRRLLQETARLPFNEQEASLTNAFEAWKGGGKQIDDVMVVGFRITI